MTRCRFLIVGGGIAGLSTAWHLARAGHGRETVLLEAEPHLASHSTARNAAILRTLSSDPLSTRIALTSADFLRQPPAGFCDVPLVDAKGLVLAAGPERADEIAGWLKAVGETPIRVEALSAARLRALSPAFRAEVAAAWSFPEEGRIDIGALVAGFVRGAQAGGVELCRDREVEELAVEDGRVCGARMRGGEEISADTTVLAAGGWAAGLGSRAGSRVALRPTRRHLLVTAPGPEARREWPVIWYFGSVAEGEFYCRPEGDGMLFCACEVTDVDPNALGIDPDVQGAIATKVARHLPDFAAAGVAHFWCGMRTLTGDGRFAVGPDPDLAGLFWVAGLGGAGMVCGAEVGRIAGRLLTGEPVAPDVETGLSPARLAEMRVGRGARQRSA
ncbi:MAG: FAD-binding oxidoreductase [Deltaproteobacteria bacterium]|jgi:D-arginine dehydrogenase|nr:FAD-binding oxidoreductase [Deltaproteobacteria bacterium]MBW2384145.1 FAD-binding oxidoreductase [Deltaproteobacteria bacterium]MBW2695154.1 FAD-binding oxidoreductase [Deltaproteobacteria bacterium]